MSVESKKQYDWIGGLEQDRLGFSKFGIFLQFKISLGQQYSKTLILVSFVIISQTFHVCGFGVLLRSFVRNSLRGFVSHGMSVKFL